MFHNIIELIFISHFSVLEVVNDEYGDYTPQLAENARCSIWRTNKIEPSTAQLIKMHETRSFTTNIKLGDINQAHYYPPPEWKRLWILIGRCHMQIFRDWVSLFFYEML